MIKPRPTYLSCHSHDAPAVDRGFSICPFFPRHSEGTPQPSKAETITVSAWPATFTHHWKFARYPERILLAGVYSPREEVWYATQSFPERFFVVHT